MEWATLLQLGSTVAISFIDGKKDVAHTAFLPWSKMLLSADSRMMWAMTGPPTSL